MSEFGDRLGAFRLRFLARAADDASGLKTEMEAQAWEDMRRRAHSLAGNAGMFGFPDVSEAARQLEEAIDEDEGDAPIATLAASLIAILETLPPA